MNISGSLSGKVALVTGGARRLGAAISRALAERGASVVVHYHHSEAGAIAMNRTLGGGVFSVRGDLANPRECEWVFREAAEWMGRVDILVNNAARFARDGEIDSGILHAVNVEAPLHLARLVAAQAGGGCVIHILDSRIALPESAPFHDYMATKRKLAESVTRLARQWAPATRVNGIAPGPVLAPEGRREPAGFLPLARRPTPEQVAWAVVFLAQNEAVTGQILFVDGGQHLGQVEGGKLKVKAE
jgi:NAD(P)-dependent dehydrogenase (short-subunit alcohol dehydrogenase family)